MNLVFIYGPPGVGKLTVAREVARATGYGLFHKHVDNTGVAPGEVARLIVGHYHLPAA